MQLINFSGYLLKVPKMIFIYKSTIYKKLEDRVIITQIIYDEIFTQHGIIIKLESKPLGLGIPKLKLWTPTRYPLIAIFKPCLNLI